MITKTYSTTCPYIDGNTFTEEYFFSYNMSPSEFNIFVQQGWRKFGYFFFRPACKSCLKCTPIRIVCKKLELTKSQRKLINKNQDLTIKFVETTYDEEVYQVYKKHSKIRFEKEANQSDFIANFIENATKSITSKYYLNDKLIAAGFLDVASNGLSSVYFVFDPDYSERGLGNYSVLKEIEYAVTLNIDYYYLGFYIPENNHMNYKNKYSPHEFYDWKTKQWVLQ